MVWETYLFFDLPVQVFPLILFVFFATFFEYNVHVIAGRLSVLHPKRSVQFLLSGQVSNTLRGCILVGFVLSVVTFLMLGPLLQVAFVVTGLITLSYTIPLIRKQKRMIRLREITYLKIFTVALGWTLVTAVVPLLPHAQTVSPYEAVLICLRRFLFIYAITIPFEIRDMEREKRLGNISLPMIYGVKFMKLAGIVMLALFCGLALVHENYFLIELSGRKNIFYPLLVSAIAAGLLIGNTTEGKSGWYYKFWVDGTMILQFVLLFLFNE